MGTRHPIGSWAALSAAVAFASAGALGADLAPTSPFLPANVAASGAAAGTLGPIELRGVMPTANGTAYCIYDSAKKKDIWVGLNETGHDFVIRSADSGSDTIKVDYQGRSMSLTLRTAKVASAGQAGTGPPVLSQGVPGVVPLNPTPGDEQKRLDAVAQEVRRRKLEREKAAQETQTGQGQPGSPNR